MAGPGVSPFFSSPSLLQDWTGDYSASVPLATQHSRLWQPVTLHHPWVFVLQPSEVVQQQYRNSSSSTGCPCLDRGHILITMGPQLHRDILPFMFHHTATDVRSRSMRPIAEQDCHVGRVGGVHIRPEEEGGALQLPTLLGTPQAGCLESSSRTYPNNSLSAQMHDDFSGWSDG